MQDLTDSELYPVFHLLPEVLQHYNSLILLPPDMRAFTTQLTTPAECLRLSKAITIAAYRGAQSALGMARAIVCTPPPELLQVLIYMGLPALPSLPATNARLAVCVGPGGGGPTEHPVGGHGGGQAMV